LAGEDARPLLEPTKGVHLVAPNRGLDSAFIFLHPRDGRVFFVIPWLNKTLIGTTDTEHAGPPDEATVTDEDVAYLLEGHNHYLAPPLERGDLLGSFVGLRPLVREAGQPRHNTSALSREFQLEAGPSGLLTAAGGKYTTYRHMAEVITEEVVRRLGLRRRCRTRDFPLDGAPAGAWADFESRAVAELRSGHGLDEAGARHLVGRYGRRAADVAAYLARDPELARPVLEGEPDLLTELAYQRDHEMACRPADFLLRRTRLGLFHPDLLRQPPAGL
jgi:glycerol-3-phosphate dehydrogenase